MKRYRILDPHAVRIGSGIAGAVVTEEQLGARLQTLLDAKAIELIEDKPKAKPDGGSPSIG